MKTIGLIGGMSWESSLEYYRILNETVKELLGSSHSAKSIMFSYNFNEIEALQNQGKWDELAASMTEIAKKLENFLRVSTEELKEFGRLTGNNDVHGLGLRDICTTNSEISGHTDIQHI